MVVTPRSSTPIVFGSVQDNEDDDGDNENLQQRHHNSGGNSNAPPPPLGFGSPFYLNPNENLAQSIVNISLDGGNYQVWSRSVKFALQTKHKIGFIDGSIHPPDFSDDGYAIWDACNTMVLCWIMNSLHPEIRRSVMNHENAQILWNELKSRFGQANALRLANLQDEIHACKQGQMTVTQYYTTIKGLWEEYGQFSPIVACTCLPGNPNICPAVLAFQTKQDTDYLIRFLRGLNNEYDVVKTQLLMMRPLPSITSAYDSALQHEEKLRGGGAISKEAVHPSAFAVSMDNSADPLKHAMAVNTDRKLFCKYCRKDNHIIEDCLKLKNKKKREQEQKASGGYTNQSTGRFAGMVVQDTESSNSSSSSSTPNPGSFTPEELHQLRTLLQQVAGPQHKALAVSHAPPQSSHHSGMYTLSASTNYDLMTTWILDTGASDHICCSLRYSLNYKAVVGVYVYLPNSTKVSVSHIGSVKLPFGLILHDVLLVPSFGFNLVSVSKLTHDSSVSLLFQSQTCFIQDRITSRTIGLATTIKGLYQLQAQDFSPESTSIPPTSLVLAVSFNFKPQDINLWHWRLGHPSEDRIRALTRCNPSVTVERIDHCEICHLAKQKRLSFPISNAIASKPFDLVHMDIWGPLHTPTHDGHSYFLTILDEFSRCVWIFLMKNKGETRELVKSFCSMVSTQFSVSVKTIRSDQGAGFRMDSFFATHGIVHQ